MFHGINELRKKAYPPSKPDALEAARRRRRSADGERRGAAPDAAGSEGPRDSARR